MMKILVLYNRLPYPLNDGGNLAVDALLRGMKQAGHEVHLLAMNTSRHYVEEDTIDSQFSYLDAIYTGYVNNNITVTGAFLALLKKKSYHVTRFENEPFRNKLIGLLKENQYDIVQFEGLYVCIYLNTVLQYSKAKAVYRQHNIEYKIWENNAKAARQPFKKWYLHLLCRQLRQFELKTLQQFQWLLSISKDELTANVQLGFNGLQHWTPFGLSTTELADTPYSKNVYHIGAMDWLPNQQGLKWFLVYIWPRVITEIPDAHFYFAGRNMPVTFHDYTNANVTCMGEVPDADDFEKGKSILIVPLQAAAGIRIKTLKAMAKSKVVVSTSRGAEGLGMQANVHFLQADSDVLFAQQLIRVLKDEQLFLQLAKASFEFVKENYLNVNIIRGLTDFYNKVIYS